MKSKLYILICIFFIGIVTICNASSATEDGWKVVAEDGVRNYAEECEHDNRYIWSTTTYTVNGVEYLYVGTTSDWDEPSKIWHEWVPWWCGFGGDPQIYRTSESNPGLDDWQDVTPQKMSEDNDILFYRGFRKMIVYEGNLYVGVHVDPKAVVYDKAGCRLWKCKEIGGQLQWSKASEDGFGFSPLHCHSIRSMAVFPESGDSHLYVGTSSEVFWPGHLMRSTSTDPGPNDWEEVLCKGPLVNGFTSLKVFNDRLYAGISGGAKIYSSPDGEVWDLCFQKAFIAVLGMEEFDGKLYVAVSSQNGAGLFRSATGESGTWEQVIEDGSITETPKPSNNYIWALKKYGNYLYAGTCNAGVGEAGSYGPFDLWRSDTGDLGDWEDTSFPGFNDDDNLGARDMIEFKNNLFAGTARIGRGGIIRANPLENKGCEIWEKVTFTSNDSPNQPNPPENIPDKLTKLKVGVEYGFSSSSTDPNGDKISYLFDWDYGEGENKKTNGWTLFMNATSSPIAYHKWKWYEIGEHKIAVRARDEYGYLSSWSSPLYVNVTFFSGGDVITQALKQNEVISQNGLPAVIGETVYFSSLAEYGAEPYTWEWETKPSRGKQTQQNVTEVYDDSLNYTVNLTVEDSEGNFSNTSMVIPVAHVRAGFNASHYFAQSGVTIVFNDTSVVDPDLHITSWNWSISNGYSNNSRNISYCFNTDGYYNVSLMVHDNQTHSHTYNLTIIIDSNNSAISFSDYHPSYCAEMLYYDHYIYPLNKTSVACIGSNITILTEATDYSSGVQNVSVNITYPDNSSFNTSMNHAYDNVYTYNFSDTYQLGKYNYEIWCVDKAGNTINSSSKNFTVIHCFGNSHAGPFYLTDIWNNITGSNFTAEDDGRADNISVLIATDNNLVNMKCMLYEMKNYSLVASTEGKNLTTNSSVQWITFNFTEPKPFIENNTDYLLMCWSNDTCLFFYDYLDSSVTKIHGYYINYSFNDSNGTPPFIGNFSLQNFSYDDTNRSYAVYCSYTKDNPPQITSVTASPQTIGFGFNVTIQANVTDNVSGVNFVKVNVTYPDQTYGNYTMTHITGNIYQYILSNSWQIGQHNYTIWVIDNYGHSNFSGGHHFHVSAQATISIATLKDNYGENEPIEITDPPMSPEDYYLVDRGLTWNKYYVNTSGNNVLEVYTEPVNYQEENGTWNPINCSLEQLATNHPAYNYGYRVGNEHGLYNVYFKPNVQSNWPVAFAYNKSDDPNIDVVRSKLVGVGYLDPASDWAYEYLQSVQSSQGQFSDNKVTYNNVFSGIDVVWSYDNMKLKEEIILSNTTKLLLQNHPPSLYGLQNASSYLVFFTKLDYQNLILYNDSGILNGNVTVSDWVAFKDAFGYFKCALPVGEAYELYNESVRYKLVYRVLQYNGNYYLLSGLRVQDLINMVFPVVIDPTITVSASESDGYIYKPSSDYYDAWSSERGTVSSDNSCISIGQIKTTSDPSNYCIYRGFFIFDTSELPPNAYIDNATLSLYKKDDYSTIDFTIMLQHGQPDYPHDPLEESDYNKDYYSGDGGSLNTMNFMNGSNNITLTELSWINVGGVTKLCLRSSRDINGTTPNGSEYVNVYSANLKEEFNPDPRPKLIITYRNQSKIKNTGSTNITGYLLIQVQYLEGEEWVVDHNTVDETSPRVINVGDQLGLDTIFNGLVNTHDLSHGSGTYRVYATFRDPEGNILICDDDSLLEASYEFTVEI